MQAGPRLAALRPVPWWLRAYLLLGTAQGLAIGLTGFFTPAHVVGFPLHTTPLNTRFVASFYLAGAVGLGLSGMARHAIDTRMFVAGFAVVTSLLLLATLMYWSDFTASGVPYPWLISYIVDPVVGAFALWSLGLARPAVPGTHRLSGIFAAILAVFGILGVTLLFFPDTAVAHWPWKLTAILARVYAAIFIAFALGAGLAALERRRQADTAVHAQRAHARRPDRSRVADPSRSFRVGSRPLDLGSRAGSRDRRAHARGRLRCSDHEQCA